MSSTSPAASSPFLPKLVTVLREGYGPGDLRADAAAGLTVAIVALPLSMAIAIASGVGPERGLVTAIVGGFLVSLLGGSRFQIGGPAGAFIVLVSACVAEIGLPGLILATALSGVVLTLAGWLRLGSYIRFMPYPVIVGFTAGIAVIILVSQIPELFGLSLAGGEPHSLAGRLTAFWQARSSVSPAAVGVALATIGVIAMVKRLRPGWPGMLVAVALASLAVAGLGLDVATLSSRFGALPRFLPAPALPETDWAAVRAAMPFAVGFTLLGAVESLLSAVVADGMTGRAHRSNAELVAQGLANIGASLFGGFCVTGTIARTATNVRAGARGPVSGMLHAVFLLAIMAVAAPLAGYIPLAALAGVLVVVAWNMLEREAAWQLLRTSRGDALVLSATLLLTVFRDLTEAIVVGFALGGLVFIRRMSETAQVESDDDGEAPYDGGGADDGVMVYRIRGALFFGAAAAIGSVLDRIAERPRALILDLGDVAVLDSTGARAIALLAQKLQRRDGQLYLSGASPALLPALRGAGAVAPLVRLCADRAEARAEARRRA
ncbi:MAG: SulP family inorganic anion transporter [Paracoccaceae bacterium]